MFIIICEIGKSVKHEQVIDVKKITWATVHYSDFCNEPVAYI